MLSIGAALVSGALLGAAPAKAGAPTSEYEPRQKAATYHRRRSHHNHYRYSRPPTVMKNGRAYFYYPGTGQPDQPAYSYEDVERYSYKRPYRFRLFDRMFRRW